MVKNVLKWIGGIGYFVAYLSLIPSIGENIFSSCNADVTYIATYNLFIIYWIMGMFVFGMFLYLFSKYGVFPDRPMGENGIKCKLPQNKKICLAVLSVLGWILSLFLSLSWYDCFTEYGCKVRRFLYSKEYTWEDVDYYTMSAGGHGTLTFSVVMKDGTRADCLDDSAMIAFENLSEDEYPEGDYDFVRALSRKFTEMGIELRVDNWEKLYRKLTYDSWDELAEDIGEIAGVGNGDT